MKLKVKLYGVQITLSPLNFVQLTDLVEVIRCRLVSISAYASFVWVYDGHLSSRG